MNRRIFFAFLIDFNITHSDSFVLCSMQSDNRENGYRPEYLFNNKDNHTILFIKYVFWDFYNNTSMKEPANLVLYKNSDTLYPYSLAPENSRWTMAYPPVLNMKLVLLPMSTSLTLSQDVYLHLYT